MKVIFEKKTLLGRKEEKIRPTNVDDDKFQLIKSFLYHVHFQTLKLFSTLEKEIIIITSYHPSLEGLFNFYTYLVNFIIWKDETFDKKKQQYEDIGIGREIWQILIFDTW
ncbi:hypothetical protein T05_11987 [Trichinella murrelli]|uniref:Uncharacterized protein n=1 Tax=Trichinella murrelli TaxID=144512 RepID=A0A0V0TRH1_9BILA|nr:hypothetical protein T05_11987 [Trichinella murrelli]